MLRAVGKHSQASSPFDTGDAGDRHFWPPVGLSVSTMRQRLGCELYLRGNTAKQAFRLLKEGQNDIERELGSLEWQELPEGQDCRIVDYLRDFDPRERQD